MKQNHRNQYFYDFLKQYVQKKEGEKLRSKEEMKSNKENEMKNNV